MFKKSKVIPCAGCDNEFYCTSYFAEFRKKDRTLKNLALMCENLGGFKK